MPRVVFASVGISLIVMAAVPTAQRGRRGGADANQGVPVATNAIVQNPSAYYGKQVTVSAGVAQMLSKTAFLVDQWKAAGPNEFQPIGKPILGIAPDSTPPFDQSKQFFIPGQYSKLAL